MAKHVFRDDFPKRGERPSDPVGRPTSGGRQVKTVREERDQLAGQIEELQLEMGRLREENARLIAASPEAAEAAWWGRRVAWLMEPKRHKDPGPRPLAVACGRCGRLHRIVDA